MNWAPETRVALEESRLLLISCWREAAAMLRRGDPLAEAVAAELLEAGADLFESADRLRRLTAMTRE
jgi:hypothetical protein